MKKIRLSKSVVSQPEADAVSRVILEVGMLGMGSEVQRFEAELANFWGVPSEQVACVATGTSALHLAVASVTKPGDEVLVQSLTFVATFQAISGAGAKPLACEVNEDTLTIDLEDAAKRCTKNTRAIMPVHYASFPGDLDAIYEFAAARRLRVIEDAAHAFGCKHRGRLIGSTGDVVCFSFDGIKNITSGEGGAVVSSDSNVMRWIRDGRLLGVERDTEKRFAGQRSWEFEVRHQGYRYHMSNMFAALGRTQLKRFRDDFAPKRVALASRYREMLSGIPGIRLLSTDLASVVPHIQPIRVIAGRNQLREHLEREGIETGIHYKPNHLLDYYRAEHAPLPVTERLYAQLLSLPLHPEVTFDDVGRICESIRAWAQAQARA